MTTAWHQQTQSALDDAWTTYVQNLEASLSQLEKDIEDAVSTREGCNNEWCQATEHVLDELGNALFSIHEPSFSKEADTKKIKELKRRLHKAYAKFDGAAH